MLITKALIYGPWGITHMLRRAHSVFPAVHKWHEPYLPFLPSCSDLARFVWYLFSISLRVEG